MYVSTISAIRAFKGDIKGSIAIPFALLATLILAAISVGIDISFAYNKRDQSQLVADEASLFAVTTFRKYVADGMSKNQARKRAETDARKFLTARTKSLDGTTEKFNIKLNIIDREAKVVKANVNISGKHESYMTHAMGFDNIDYTAESESTISFGQGKYEFIFLVDVSPSMGIGASNRDRQIMQRAIGCQFACHEPWYSSVSRAKSAGARLRIDVVKDALKSLVTQLEEATEVDLKTGLYSFSNYLHIQTGLNDGISKFKREANKIAIHREYLRGGGTNFHGVFSDFNGVLRSLKPKADVKQHIIIISDAVNHLNLRSGRSGHLWNQTPNWRPYNYSFNPSWCDEFKKGGARTVHTMLVEPDRPHYVRASTSSMRACATSAEYFYSANSAAEIDKAFKDLFEALLKSVYVSG